MATENELKYVLYNTDKIAEEIVKLSEKTYNLRQGYLIGTTLKQVRIRESVSTSGKIKHVMTVKFKTKQHIIEIETKIDSRDFGDLSKLVTTWLRKTRHVIPFGPHKWEVDLFYYSKKRYFIMAEVELPEGETNPDSIPDFIKNNLLYAVPQHANSTYSSRKIGEYDYAVKTYEHLINTLSEGSKNGK